MTHIEIFNKIGHKKKSELQKFVKKKKRDNYCASVLFHVGFVEAMIFMHIRFLYATTRVVNFFKHSSFFLYFFKYFGTRLLECTRMFKKFDHTYSLHLCFQLCRLVRVPILLSIWLNNGQTLEYHFFLLDDFSSELSI